MKYNVKDIVYVENYTYKNGSKGKNHNFVIVENGKAIDIDYYGLLMSSKIEKANFPYNVLIPKNEMNRLRKDSIVKCDDLINIEEKEIKFKIGEVTDNDLDEFLKRFEKYTKAIKLIDYKSSQEVNQDIADNKNILKP